MVNKRKQYSIKQFSLSDVNKDSMLEEKEGEKYEISQSENFLFYQCYNKTLKREIKSKESNVLDEIITIETGRGANDKQKEKLQKILQNGVTYQNKKYVFLDMSISGSQHKNVRQFFVQECLYSKILERITLNKIPKNTVTAKYLVAVALMSTSCNLIDINLDELDICIVDDLEFDIQGQHIVYNKEYERTPEEQESYEDIITYIEDEKDYRVLLGRGRKKAVDKKLPKRSKENISKQLTFRQLKEIGLRPKVDELESPITMTYAKGIYKYVPCWSKEQCETIPESKEVPVNRVTTGIDFVEDNNATVPLNFSDGTGIVSFKLAEKLWMGLGTEKSPEGFQLRLPYIKSFAPVVDIQSYMEDEEIKCSKDEKGHYITDIWGKKHYSNEIDLVITTSCFKAKLDFTEDEQKKWLFTDINEYMALLKRYGYDKIGIANYVHIPKSEYTKVTYQMLLALNLKNVDLAMFAEDEGQMINKVLEIYKGDEINWDDVKYVLAFLNILKDEKEKAEYVEDEDNAVDNNEELEQLEEVEEIEEFEETDQAENTVQDDEMDTNDEWEEIAIQAIRLNKEMVFDAHIRKKILERITHMINEMRLGKILMPCNYYFATCHIPTLLNWIVHRDIERIKESVPNNVAIMGNKQGLYVGMRNPVTSYAEVAKIEIINDTCKYSRHLRNIVQFGSGLFMPRMNMDFDGDKICLFSTENNYKETKIRFLQHWQNKKFTIDDKEVDGFTYTDKFLKKHLNKINSDGEVTIADFVVDTPCQVNYADKLTAVPKEFNKEAVIDFIVNADDKTGQITDKATQVENRALAIGDFQEYKYEIRYGKYLQGLQIDASKSQLEVKIAEAYDHKFHSKPQFLYYKNGGKKFRYDNEFESPLDYFATTLLENYLKNHVQKMINKNTKERKDSMLVGNTVALLRNNNLDLDVIKDVEDKIRDEFIKYRQEFKTIIKKYRNIDSYSKSDRNKELRKQKRVEFSKLNEETRAQLYEISDNPSLIATAAVNYAYKYSKENSKENKKIRWEKNYNFAWVFSEGLLYNLFLNQDEEKIDIELSDERSNYDFKMLDKYYIVCKCFKR